jgi:hypothetical protein
MFSLIFIKIEKSIFYKLFKDTPSTHVIQNNNNDNT